MKIASAILFLTACCLGGCADSDGVYSSEPAESSSRAGDGSGDPARNAQSSPEQGVAPSAPTPEPGGPPGLAPGELAPFPGRPTQ